jgi:hypothetical protein
MLLEFRAENVRSFRNEFHLSLLATRLALPPVVRRVPWRSGGKTLAVLPGAGIFGANASGKTGVLRALQDMRDCVLHSFRHGRPSGGFVRAPFALDPTAEQAPSRFEIDLVLEGVRHEYGFVADDERVLEEWVVAYPHGRAALVFERQLDRFTFGREGRAKNRAVAELVRPNALFLSTAASANHERLLPLYRWFERNLLFATTPDRTNRQALTTKLLHDPGRRESVLSLLQAADLGVVDAEREELEPEVKKRLERALAALRGEVEGADDEASVRVELQDLGVRLVHRGVGEPVALPSHAESLGTMVWFGLVGPVLQALADGRVLLIDELDASLHPVLVERVVRLFQDPESNPYRAQLLFNSHDPTLLAHSAEERLLGRDQIWFTEKLNDGSTRLYPLSDLNPRKDEALDKRYLQGRYGGVPLIQHGRFVDAAENMAASVKQ